MDAWHSIRKTRSFVIECKHKNPYVETDKTNASPSKYFGACKTTFSLCTAMTAKIMDSIQTPRLADKSRDNSHLAKLKNRWFLIRTFWCTCTDVTIKMLICFSAVSTLPHSLIRVDHCRCAC